MAPALRATQTTVVCPRCNEYDVDIADARTYAARGDPVPCWLCKKRSTPNSFDASGFVSWGISGTLSQEAATVDAALERALDAVEKGAKLAAAHVREACDTLMG